MTAFEKNWRMIAGAAALGTLAGVASAQTPCPQPDNCITNPGFEIVDPFSSAGLPQGWSNLSNPNESKRRTLTDGLNPPAVVHSGQASFMLASPASATDFRGFSTDTINFFAAGLPFYDPAYPWYSELDVRVSGWYYIPSSDPIVGQVVGIKLDAKSGLDAPAANRNQNWATLDPWSGEAPVIVGHTNNEWMYYEATWSYADLVAEVAANGEAGYFPYPQFAPGRMKITVGRWSPDVGPASGTIFWDDLKIEYVAGGPQCPPCAADFNNDGGVGGDDLAAFFAAYEAGELCGDVNGDGGVGGDDLAYFFSVYEAGGC